MKTVHIFKSNCFMSSRIMMQSEWDQETFLVHLRENHDDKTDDCERKLTFLSLLIYLYSNRKNKVSFIFHCQSSLPYLVLSFYFKKIFKLDGFQLIYDIHDLHEIDINGRGIIANIKGYLRYYVFLYLENILVKKVCIKIMTVSNGIAKYYEKKHNINNPIVVRNVGNNINASEFFSDKERYEKDLLFFGKPERIPFEIFQACNDQDINIHLYGKGVKDAVEVFHNSLGNRLNNINSHGPYEPNDLEFLKNYRYLLLYKPNDLRLNYKYSLPNKFFQAISYGISIVVSPNFNEMIDLFGHIPGAIVVVDNEKDLNSLITENNKYRTENFFSTYNKSITLIHNKTKKDYLELSQNNSCKFNTDE